MLIFMTAELQIRQDETEMKHYLFTLKNELPMEKDSMNK